MTDLTFTSATELAALIRAKHVSPVEIVEGYLARIDKLDPELNSFVTVADRALEDARLAEKQVVERDAELPPFHGVPITIKDLQETKGVRTTFSTKMLEHYVPDEDAYVVRRIADAGFIMLGKTNTPEFGTLPVTESELNGNCRNPWDPARTPGGSSGGAAASLAAGLSPIAQGSDGGGSIRIPASCCGLFGVKPSRGRVSSGPRLGDAVQGFSLAGPIARTVRDAAALLDVMAGYEVGDPYWAPPPERAFADEVGRDPGRLRIGFTTAAPTGVPVDDACVAAVRRAAALLGSLGHDVEEAAPDWNEDDSIGKFIKIWQSLTSYFVAVLDPQSFEPVNRTLAEMASVTNVHDYVQTLVQLQAFSRRVVSFWNDHDVLLTPTLALVPVPVGWLFEQEDPWAQLVRSGMFTPFTPVFNVTGQPAVSVPLHESDDGLPIGVQLVGPPAGESLLLRLAAQVEQARPWAHRRPPLS